MSRDGKLPFPGRDENSQIFSRDGMPGQRKIPGRDSDFSGRDSATRNFAHPFIPSTSPSAKTSTSSTPCSRTLTFRPSQDPNSSSYSCTHRALERRSTRSPHSSPGRTGTSSRTWPGWGRSSRSSKYADRLYHSLQSGILP